jgi:type VI secretion system protein ImpL
MGNLNPLLAMLVSRWTSSFAGIAIASMLVWYLGPLVPGLRGQLPRALMILALVLVWALVNGVLSWIRRRRDRALAAGVTGTPVAGGRNVRADAAEEVARLRNRMRASLTRLRAGGGRGYLYEQPWFVLIGPPGSGKTTALLNSGLQFPLAQPDGTDAAVGGVGGTRLCDWWFADEAVLIDTAGRYTTQDSDAAVDQAGWHGFLDLLRRTRPRQPINGVIVVISLADIVAAEGAERGAHARAIRRRVTEISDRLRLRVPVYVMFSKADRLTGFNEYFDDLDAEARGQVWGMTFPLTQGAEAFTAEFSLLLDRLDERLFERLQAERAPDRRALIAGFPLQVASLAQPLADFLSQAFGGTKLDPAPFLRGVYMTSATQEGTPIDRLTGMLARAFGLDQKRAPSLRPVAGRSYFLRRTLLDVVLGEALLVTARSVWQRRRRWLRAGGFAVTGLATLVGALLLWRVEATNRLAVERDAEAIAAYRGELAAAQLDPVADDALPRIVPLLDSADALPRERRGWLDSVWGLSQSGKLLQSDALVYRHVLEQVLLPRLVWRLEQQMRARFDDAGFLYEATRVYLMLGGAGPLDRDLVRSWMIADWQARYPGELNATLRDHLAHHLDALFAEPLPTVTLDGALVSAARATFSRVPLAQRVYSRIRGDASAAAVPGWSPALALGPTGPLTFVRPSGKLLTDGVPGLYTVDGFSVLLRDLPAATHAVAGESWVLGQEQEIPQQGPAVAKLENDVVALYVADYEKAWDALLDDLALAPFPSRAAAIQSLYVLSSPQSPVRDLLLAIAHQVTLPQGAAPTSGEQASGTPQPGTPQKARLAALVGDPAPGMAGGWDLDKHFKRLRDLVGDGQATAPLAGVLHLINSLQQELARSGPDATDLPATLQAGGDPVQLLLAEAQRQPAPVAKWLQQIAATGQMTLGSAAQHAAATAFSGGSGPGPLCNEAVTGRYPFDAGSSQDAPLDDFARLFAPGGLLDSFFQTQVKPFAVTDGAVWRVQPLDGVAPPVDAAGIAQFQRAAAIRDMFFPTGGNQPQLRFTLTPVAASSGAATATLTLGGTVIKPGAVPATLTWPGADGMSVTGLTFDPVSANSPPLEAHGAWALFRLLRRGQVSPSGRPEEFSLGFQSGADRASYTLQAGSSRNPFGRNVLEGFRCPVVR